MICVHTYIRNVADYEILFHTYGTHIASNIYFCTKTAMFWALFDMLLVHEVNRNNKKKCLCTNVWYVNYGIPDLQQKSKYKKSYR